MPRPSSSACQPKISTAGTNNIESKPHLYLCTRNSNPTTAGPSSLFPLSLYTCHICTTESVDRPSSHCPAPTYPHRLYMLYYVMYTHTQHHQPQSPSLRQHRRRLLQIGLPQVGKPRHRRPVDHAVVPRPGNGHDARRHHRHGVPAALGAAAAAAAAEAVLGVGMNWWWVGAVACQGQRKGKQGESGGGAKV